MAIRKYFDERVAKDVRRGLRTLAQNVKQVRLSTIAGQAVEELEIIAGAIIRSVTLTKGSSETYQLVRLKCRKGRASPLPVFLLGDCQFGLNAIS